MRCGLNRRFRNSVVSIVAFLAIGTVAVGNGASQASAVPANRPEAFHAIEVDASAVFEGVFFGTGIYANILDPLIDRQNRPDPHYASSLTGKFLELNPEYARRLESAPESRNRFEVRNTLAEGSRELAGYLSLDDTRPTDAGLDQAMTTVVQVVIDYAYAINVVIVINFFYFI